MFIAGLQIDDHKFFNLSDETKRRIEVLKAKLRRSDLGLLDQAMIEHELKELLGMSQEQETNDSGLSKAERRKLRRERKKASDNDSHASRTVERDAGAEQNVDVPESPLVQTFKSADGKSTFNLTDVIGENDVYKKERRRKEGRKKITETKWLIKRDAVRRIADLSGITTVEKKLIIAPSMDNHQLIAFDVTVKDNAGKETTMLGEASDENTAGVSRLYKGLTAERRGYVRAVFVHLNLQNLYGEDEFVEEDDEVTDNLPSLPEYEGIAKFINKMTEAKTKDELKSVGEEIQVEKDQMTQPQLEYLKSFYKKNLLRFEQVAW